MGVIFILSFYEFFSIIKYTLIYDRKQVVENNDHLHVTPAHADPTGDICKVLGGGPALSLETWWHCHKASPVLPQLLVCISFFCTCQITQGRFA